jgi:hypothetical protein
VNDDTRDGVEEYDYGRHLRSLLTTSMFLGGVASVVAGFAVADSWTVGSVAAGVMLVMAGLLQLTIFYRLFTRWFW